MNKVTEFSFDEPFVTDPQYFQGRSTMFTQWADVFVGTGSTPSEAAEDALNDAAENDWDVEDIKVDHEQFPKENDEETENALSDEESSLQWYAVLWVK